MKDKRLVLEKEHLFLKNKHLFLEKNICSVKINVCIINQPSSGIKYVFASFKNPHSVNINCLRRNIKCRNVA